jgi:hypothetical protein
MSEDEILGLISDQIMFLTIAKAQLNSRGKPVYEPKMLSFAVDALEHLSNEVKTKFKEKR